MEYYGKANKAKEESKKAEAKEKVQIAVIGSYGTDGEIDMNKLNTNLENVEGIDKNTLPVEKLPHEVIVDGYKVTIDGDGDVTVEEEVIEEPENPPTPPTPVEFSKAYGRIEVLWLDTNDQIQPNPNTPNLGNMTPVKWNGTTETNTTSDDPEWYQYKAKTGKEDNLESHWANAKNGTSYFVWIPRYAYRITYYADSDSDQVTGYCDGDGIREVDGTVRQALSPSAKTVELNGIKYIVHPAFRDGKSNNFKNGEWDSELSGIWVAKYEASRSNATVSSAGSSTTIKIAPNVQGWGGLTPGSCYSYAYNLDRSKESHLMKNSEWGAVAYLTQSQYGRNGHEIDINNSSSYVTGNGGGSPTASEATGVTNAYNTETGAKASTTGNIYGIYDLSGGKTEYVASYVTNGARYLASYGSPFVAKTTADPEGYKSLSTKYATVYPYDGTNDTGPNNYRAYKEAGYGYGDSILETTAEDGTTNWFSDECTFAQEGGPFFHRGRGYFNVGFTGTFSFSAFNGSGGNADIAGFRPVLAF